MMTLLQFPTLSLDSLHDVGTIGIVFLLIAIVVRKYL
jgi:hypothetical protein